MHCRNLPALAKTAFFWFNKHSDLIHEFKRKHYHYHHMTPSLPVHRKRRSTKRSSLRSSSRSQKRCASSVTAARPTSKRWFCDVIFFYRNFHISKMLKFYSDILKLTPNRGKIDRSQEGTGALGTNLWCRCQLYRLWSFVSRFLESCGVLCCAVLYRKKWNMPLDSGEATNMPNAGSCEGSFK